MMIDLESLKAAFRKRAADFGIDPERGATAFQAVAVQTEIRKRTHHLRQRRAVYHDAKTKGPTDTYQVHEYQRIAPGGRWSAVPLLRTQRYSHWDNGQGAINWEKVERAMSRLWWVDQEIWKLGKSRFTVKVRVESGILEMNGVIAATEVQAVRNLRAEARRLEGQEIEPTSYEQISGALIDAFAEVREQSRLEREAHQRYLSTLPVQQGFAFTY